MLLPVLGLLSTACSDDDNTTQEPTTPEVPNIPEPEPEPIAGCSLWQDYLAARTNGEETTLLDFSYAGYEHGER